MSFNLKKYEIPLEEIKRATENFSQKRCIGGGGFGAVYLGELSEVWSNHTAAIKRLDPDSHQGRHEFHNELEMISSFHHENIISFLGFCDKDNEMIIVYEYAKNGSLDHHLRDPNKMRCISWTQRLKICLGAATGFHYLHSGLGENTRVLHRDVKSGNILLDHRLVAKISDFGLSKLDRRNEAASYTKINTKVAGTDFYMDPAYRESSILGKESDVYSLGVVLFEMLSGRLVYSKRSIGEDRPEFLMNFVRRYVGSESEKLIDPYIEYEVDFQSFETFKDIAYQCINLDPASRPTMKSVIEKIAEALAIQESRMPDTSLQAESDINSNQTLRLAYGQDNVDVLIECIMQEIGFSHGKPVAAFTIYKCLLHWRSLEAKNTFVFQRLFEIIESALSDQDKNKDQMAYWLSNASTLLFLIQKSIKQHDGGSSSQKSLPPILETEAACKVVEQVEAKHPALYFKTQLTYSVEKMYCAIRDNLKEELQPLLKLCIQATSRLRYEQAVREDSESKLWQDIVDRLNTILHTLRKNYVPPIIVQKIFAENFSSVNVQLFNSIFDFRYSALLSDGQYMKIGLTKLEQWCCQAKEEYAGSAWDELKHIREAASFRQMKEKYTFSYEKIMHDICPSLNIQQVYAICLMDVDPRHRARNVSSEVVSLMEKVNMEDRKKASKSTIRLEDSSSISFSIDDLSSSLHVEDFAKVKPAIELKKYREFGFLYN